MSQLRVLALMQLYAPADLQQLIGATVWEAGRRRTLLLVAGRIPPEKD